MGGKEYTAAVMVAKKARPRGPQLELAGDLSVAFVNTTGAREDNRQLGVGSYADLLAWGRQAGVLATLEAERLSRRAAEQPRQAETAFAGAKELRSVLFRMFLATSSGKEPAAADLGTVSDSVAEAMPARRLTQDGAGVTWLWAGDEDAFDRVLWSVLLSTAELLVAMQGRPQVRQCAAEGCTLFFVDPSPSRRRRWCEMEACGNRIKSLRYYHRKGKINRSRNWLYPKPPARR